MLCPSIRIIDKELIGLMIGFVVPSTGVSTRAAREQEPCLLHPPDGGQGGAKARTSHRSVLVVGHVLVLVSSDVLLCREVQSMRSTGSNVTVSSPTKRGWNKKLGSSMCATCTDVA
jgi:hypothetical protein